MLYIRIGKKAQADGYPARGFRLIAGALTIGFILAGILYIALPPFPELQPRYDGDIRFTPEEQRRFTSFIIAPLASLGCTGLLEWIRSRIDGD